MSLKDVTTEELNAELTRRKNESMSLTVMLCESRDGRRWFETLGAIVNSTKVLDQVVLKVDGDRIEVVNPIHKTKISFTDFDSL